MAESAEDVHVEITGFLLWIFQLQVFRH